jgi:tRNA pseudouridine38-40 synthase
MNYRLTIQYDGTDFHGWQVQTNQRTVQGELEKILGTLEGSAVHVAGSGRTDAGVHAEGQVASIKLTKIFAPEKLRAAINGNSRQDLRVLQVEETDEDFHARFSARGKTYIYRVINSPVSSPFWARYALHESRSLDIARMKEAVGFFLGTHDWTAFSAAQSDVETRVRTITEFTVETRWDSRAQAQIIEFCITADGFLRYMVRSIVGTMLEAGRDEKDFDTIQTAIKGGDRSFAGATAPAKGLTLLKVYY